MKIIKVVFGGKRAKSVFTSVTNNLDGHPRPPPVHKVLPPRTQHLGPAGTNRSHRHLRLVPPSPPRLHKIIKGPSGRELIVGGPNRYKYVADCIKRINKLQNLGVKVIMVFDGGPLPGKREEEESRRRYILEYADAVRKPSLRGKRCWSRAMRPASRS
jgi:hypothetical protein